MRVKRVDMDEVVEYLMSQRVAAMRTPLPLPQLVDILVDMWEADGFYD